MFSYWERQSFLHSDIIIIGAGILGLSTACSLKELRPERSVLVLERGLLPTGASTKNAGFACFGSLSELVADAERLGEERMLQLVEMRWRGLAHLDRRLGEEAMDFRHYGGYELLTGPQLELHRHIDWMNDLLLPLFGMEVFHSVPSRVKEFGFDGETVKDVIFNPFEGQLDTGKLMKALAAKSHSLGVEILTGAEVTALYPLPSGVEAVVQHNGEQVRFTAAACAVCTNAFLPALVPEMSVRPGRGQVLITRPVAGLKFKGAFHFDEGYYYFRDLDGRVVFGGGRNLDMEQEATTAFEPNERILADLKEKLRTIILPNTPFEIEQTWQGIMGFGTEKFPVITTPQPNVWAALGCNGMGVMLSSMLGDELADRILA